jgi:DNA invertase Pin-like site-specific DNA recombinase
MFMKTAIYVRVSTNDQTTENQLPDRDADDA